MTYSNGDTLTKKGAEELAAKIRAHWQAVGRDIEVWVEPVQIHNSKVGHHKTMYAVRSDLKV